MVSDKLKQFIFKRLYKKLGNTEIIPHENSIWFINREKKYWYFEFEGNDTLWWRYDFFPSFFSMFSLERADFEQILASWVEEVLNHRVNTATNWGWSHHCKVEEVLNHKVSTTQGLSTFRNILVEEVLNHKVETTFILGSDECGAVEEVLNNTEQNESN
jgi:hypothetical protein